MANTPNRLKKQMTDELNREIQEIRLGRKPIVVRPKTRKQKATSQNIHCIPNDNTKTHEEIESAIDNSKRWRSF